METRKIEEQSFHDRLRTLRNDEGVTQTRWTPSLERTIETDPLWSNMKYYSIERKSRTMVLEWLKAQCQSKTVLDYCCGNGEDAIFMGEIGAKRVIGIDVSQVSIENCRRLALKRGVVNVHFKVADAENTGFEDDSFDIINEYGELHHLDLEKAFSEIARILRRDGKAICTEALGHNPIIHLYRKLTPQLRTPWEVDHIFRKEHVRFAEKFFEDVQCRFFHLGTLLAVPFRGMPWFSHVLSLLEKLDTLALSLPVLKWQAWQVVLFLSQPRKS